MRILILLILSLGSLSAKAGGNVTCTGYEFTIRLNVASPQDSISINGVTYLVRAFEVVYSPRAENATGPGPMTINSFSMTNGKRIDGLVLSIPRTRADSYDTLVTYEAADHNVHCTKDVEFSFE